MGNLLQARRADEALRLRARAKRHPRRTDEYMRAHCPPATLDLDEFLFMGDRPDVSLAEEIRGLTRLLRELNRAPVGQA